MKMSRFVFVDIDTQFDFMRPEGGLYVPEAESLEPQLAKLIKHAQANGIPVVASADAHTADDPEFSQFPPHCIQGTAGQKRVESTLLTYATVIPNQPVKLDLDQAQALVLEKTVFDIFGNPNAEQVFESLAPEMCYVFGVATDYCVRAAALGLRQRGYAVTVVSDAIKAVTPEGETQTLAEMAGAGIHFAATSEVLKEAVL
jgi:nicotinamidase/pyrazinamidase